MGSCVSLSRPPPSELGWQVAKVVGLDGSMARFEGPVTAREALLAASGGGRHRHAQSPACFLCSADELGFDAPARALSPDEPLQPGQLYFVLPASALRRPLSGQDMAALAVKAVEAGVPAIAALGVSLPSRRKEAGKLRTKAARVAPLAAALSSSSKESTQSSEGASWRRKQQRYEYDSGRTVGKTRRRGVVRGAQRLSAIAEGSE